MKDSTSSNDQTPMTLTEALGRIYSKVSKEGFNTATVVELGAELELVSESFGIVLNSAILLAAIIEQAGSCNYAEESSLASYMGCTYIQFLKHHSELRDMSKKGIILIAKVAGESYRATHEVLRALEEGKPFQPKKSTDLNPAEFFARFKEIYNRFNNECPNQQILLDNLEYLIHNNTHLAFCREALASDLYKTCDDDEKTMFFYLCYRYLTDGVAEEDLGLLMNFVEREIDPVFYSKAFAHEETALQIGDLFTFASMDGAVDPSVAVLSDRVKKDFFAEAEIPGQEVPKYKDLVSVNSIAPRELFFNEEEGKQIARLEGLLKEDALRNIQDRLTESGMRKGFNVLLYGPPGTGKTAIAYELARRTGRDVFRAEVTRLRSKWVGESEKSVKALFNIYKKLCKPGNKAPILLFNEADAIFSKRYEDVHHSVDQLNNTIQNIILQEMESLEGILIATTNLVTNLDPAFERRFIYKIEMKKPQKESRAKIWKSMLGNLTEAEADILAGEFDFSGGNIENIARKSTVEYVLTGMHPTLSSVEILCREELLRGTGRTKIGF